jgi:hypothetical protein
VVRTRTSKRQQPGGSAAGTTMAAAKAAMMVCMLHTSSATGRYQCADDTGCQLNGACVAGACSCHAGWRGEDCGLLDLLPSAHSDHPGLSYGAPPGSAAGGLASWGGSIVTDPHTSGLYHLYAAEMSLGCGLNSWYRNSVIIHATSTSPLGPFVRKDQVLGAFSHEPVVLTLPRGEGYVLYKIGCADNATTGSNGTWPPRLHEPIMSGRCEGCKDGVTGKSVLCSHPDQVYERECQDALFSKSLGGPWLRQNLSGFGRSDWPWETVNLGLGPSPDTHCNLDFIDRLQLQILPRQFQNSISSYNRGYMFWTRREPCADTPRQWQPADFHTECVCASPACLRNLQRCERGRLEWHL